MVKKKMDNTVGTGFGGMYGCRMRIKWGHGKQHGNYSSGSMVKCL